MNIKKTQKKLDTAFGGKVSAAVEDGCVILRGTLGDWSNIVSACSMAVQKQRGIHVVNDIQLEGASIPKMRLPGVADKSLDGRAPDVLIIGGGISGAAIARELSKWELDILLVEKEADVAMQASGRNDGEVHPGIDLGRGTLKHAYIRRANAMFDRLCDELAVPFDRCGQYVLFTQPWLRPLVGLYVLWRKYHAGIEDSTLISGKAVLKREPNANPNTRFAIYNPSAGSVCPYGLTIAYAENAVQNGVKIALETAVTGMDVENGKIKGVFTNRGTLYPRLVINAAGVFAEDVAAMAGDRFYSIHPRRGTNTILDKKQGRVFRSIAGIKEFTTEKTHTKGGGILHTAHGNLLVGPDAVETFEKENFSTDRETIERVFKKQKKVIPELSERDVITYFTGVRAPTFEEDYIIETGRKTKNLIHCAGIQSPGLTTAPAVALDIEKMAVAMLSRGGLVRKNSAFTPRRNAAPVLRHLGREERAALIAQKPDYGAMVCRCEEISKGEILDALNSPFCVPTVDGVKKRLRPGMGRCQGGFCAPLVATIIAEHQGILLSEVKKSGEGSELCFGETKGAGAHAAV